MFVASQWTWAGQGPRASAPTKVVPEQADLDMVKETAPMVKHARPEALSRWRRCGTSEIHKLNYSWLYGQ
jgi:hypothetical protein